MSDKPFQLSVDGFSADHFRVRSLRGKETLSEAFSFHLQVACDSAMDLERAALGKRATVILDVGEAPRAFYGIVSQIELEGTRLGNRGDNQERSLLYRVAVVPRLWLLKRRRKTRIFQGMRVPDVVAAVLAESGIASRWQLTRAYPAREYLTQYEETDYGFIRRLLAEAGVFFYFPEGPEVSSSSSALGAVVKAVSAAVGEELIPGETFIGADDSACYPVLRGDDGATLLASTAAAFASDTTSAAGLGGAAAGAVGAIASQAVAAVENALSGAPVLQFRPHESGGAGASRDHISKFSLTNSVRSNAATFRDYDPAKPMVRLESKAVSSTPFPPSALEAATMGAASAANAAGAVQGLVPGASAIASGVESAVDSATSAVEKGLGFLGQPSLLEVYDHHGPFLFPKWAFGSDEAPKMLRQARRRASIAVGESGCPDLCPGHRFQLEGHPAAQLDGSYVVVSVEHRGDTTSQGSVDSFQIYSNAFECAPASVTYVPRKPKRKSVQVSLTATVVGPAGEEIHVDDKGQIKVQFHWDRDGKNDGKSSCWIRVMQPWAGAGWGHQFIPRVGMEVVVAFEGGDPDKPMVLGSLYNGTHPTAFQLPLEKTRSGIRTQVTPGGGGSNELSFDDARGQEQVLIHAFRNFDERVGKDHTVNVQNDERIHILGGRIDRIEKSLESLIRGDQSVTVEGNRKDVVQGDVDARVKQSSVTRIEGTERREITGQANHEYAVDLKTKVVGSSTTIVGTQDKKRSWVTHAEGTSALTGSEKLELGSDKELVITVGKSSIRITPDKIELTSAAISAKGGGAGLSASKDGLALASKGDAQLTVEKKLVIKTTGGASLSMDKEVKVDAAQILMNSPEQAKDTPPKDPDPPTKIALTDQKGGKLKQQKFRIILDDKSEITGHTDDNGEAELELTQGGKVTFPELIFPDDATTGGPMLPYVVRQGDHLDKLAFVHGFDADAVWNDAKNADLKKSRKTGNLLHPGDVIQFPRPDRVGQPLSKGTSNSYKATVPTTNVKITMVDAKGPFANEPYVVEGLGEEVTGTSGGDGSVSFDAPLHVREARVVFTQRRVAIPVGIGDMDPINEPAGIRKRLEHLGFRTPSPGATEDDNAVADAAAIRSFQASQGMTPTGTVDDATSSALQTAHGS